MQQSTTTHSGHMIRPPQWLIEELHAAFIAVSTAPLLALASMFLSTTHQEVPEDNLLNELHPLVTLISFPATKSNPDTMTLNQVLCEPDAHKFIKAMEREVADHVTRGHWEVVPNSVMPQGNKPILAIWSMKRKRDPGGAIIKWKARLCAHGGMQTKGINYWETYSLVVSWTTVRLVLILSLIMGWHMRSLDFVMAYPQADIKMDIFMCVPLGCVIPGASQGWSILNLCKNLYGLKDAGKTWHKYLRDGLLRRGFKQSQVDPCLFTKGNVLIVMYVDDAVVILPNKDKISAIIRSLQADYVLTDDGDLRDYLGVRIFHDGKKVTMYQPKMTRQCLDVLSMLLPEAWENKLKMHDTPATPKSTLHADSAGPDRKCTWNYRAAVGVLNYLQAMTCSDISFAVHRCARHCNAPKLCHEQEVKQICSSCNRI